jgi:ribosomal protein L16/L10AE
MQLKPKKTLYSKYFRLKRLKPYKNAPLNYGTCGLKILSPLFLTSKHLSRFLLTVKKSTKKSEKTLRSFWVNYSLTSPITKKAKGSRMGKGKGKITLWGSKSNSGCYLVELKGLRFGRALFFLKLLQYSLNTKTTIRFQTSKTSSSYRSSGDINIFYFII